MQVLQSWAGKPFRRDLKMRDTKQTEEEKGSCSSRSSALLQLKSREDLCRVRMLQQHSGDGFFFFFQRCSLAHLIASTQCLDTSGAELSSACSLFQDYPRGQKRLGHIGDLQVCPCIACSPSSPSLRAHVHCSLYYS